MLTYVSRALKTAFGLLAFTSCVTGHSGRCGYVTWRSSLNQDRRTLTGTIVLDDTPVKHRAENLPRWMAPSVLKQWEKPFAKDHGAARHRASMASYLRNPSGLFGDLVRRWPNSIEATVYVRRSFNELPRFPYQIGECLGRAARFAARLSQARRDER